MATVRYTTFSLCRRMLSQARSYWCHIVGIFLLDTLATPLSLLKPVPLMIAVDSVVGSHTLPRVLDVLIPSFAKTSPFRLLGVAAVLQVLIVLLTQLQDLAKYVLHTYTGGALTLGFRAQLFRHVERLSLSYHDTKGTADSIYRIQEDASAIQLITIDGVLPFLSESLKLVAMIYIVVRLDWRLAVVALAVSPLLVIYPRIYDRRMGHRYVLLKELESYALKVLQEVLTALRLVKAFGREDKEQERYVRHSGAGIQARIQLASAEGAFGLAVNLTTAVGTALVLFIGIRSVMSGNLSVGQLLVVINYLSELYGPLEAIPNQLATLQSSLAGAHRAFELLDEGPEVFERSNGRKLKRAVGAIEFRNVSFTYDSRNPVLRDVSFAVSPGTRLGIKGRTGAGKTTLTSLLMRFYDPTSGQILLDGVDIRDYTLADLRKQFALVLQEPILFSTTIWENIAYGRPDADEEEIAEAARAANVHDFIAGLPKGYQTQVGERGMTLSGGERQRIALARAFLKDAPILILDEPTSSVDVATEQAIIESMERLMSGRTVLLIAHRPCTLDICDARLEIAHGCIVSAEGKVEWRPWHRDPSASVSELTL